MTETSKVVDVLLLLGRKQQCLVWGLLYCLLYTPCLMQLSVACNLILEGVRTLTWRWIISHRRSRMAVYVLWCNGQNKSHSNHFTCIRLYSGNCPSVICLPSMFDIFYGETPLVNCEPRSFSLHRLINHNQALFTFCNFVLLFYCKHFFHTIRLILCFQQTGEIDNLTVSWGKVFWLCCVQVPRCCWRR